MGDISIVARRLQSGKVLYGYFGNGGYFRSRGDLLLEWYNTPEMVDYLFSLGQLSLLSYPHSEDTTDPKEWFINKPTGEKHHESDTERLIFSKIMFIDYGYFYDTDNIWYYIIPGPFRIKIPLFHIKAKLLETEAEDEFDYLRQLEYDIFMYMFNEYYDNHSDFRDYLRENGFSDKTDIIDKFGDNEYPLYEIWNKRQKIFGYFDDWILVNTTSDFCDVTGFTLKKKSQPHIETIEWKDNPGEDVKVKTLDDLKDVLYERAYQRGWQKANQTLRENFLRSLPNPDLDMETVLKIMKILEVPEEEHERYIKKIENGD